MKYLLVSTLVLFSCLYAFTQEHRHNSHTHNGINRCSTMEVLEHMKAEDPELEQRMIQLEKELQHWIENNQEYINNSKEIITIPVVVHVVYKVAAQNISDAQVFSQIDVLNEDFQRLNADTFKTPSIFKSVAANCQIQFCMAQQTPTGAWTNGIERRQTTVTSFTDANNYVKYYNTGGLNIWDRNKYFNIWVCNLSDGLLGYAQFPGQSSATDGIVINYSNFGRTGLLASPFNKGRTATHETGHWLSLYHIWGDDNGACTGTDYINDTPNQADLHYDCPSFPQSSCGNTSDMFMNYMDYTDDACMNLFTNLQKNRMIGVMNTSRASLKTSQMCNVLGVTPNENIRGAMVFPNPAASSISVRAFLNNPEKAVIRLFDLRGRLILSSELGFSSEISAEIDVSSLERGIYIVEIQSGNTKVSRRVAITE